MKQITTSKGSWIFLEINKELSKNHFMVKGSYVYTEDPYGGIIRRELPKGNYTFLCTTDTITEDIAKGVVGDYTQPLVEFANLIDNNNLSPDKTYAICKQN